MNIRDVFKNYNPSIINRPYIIAEAGVNHEGKMELAKRLIDEAAAGGAHAIKFQTYKAEKLASKISPSYWDLNEEPTTSQVELFRKYDKFWKTEYEELKLECDRRGIEFMSTPFDVDSADFLNDLMPVFKISSSDITNFPFIRHMCRFKKPILLSTGASRVWEIQQAVELINEHGNDLCLLHCILNYPTLIENANLGMILSQKIKFPELLPGYSDHTMPGNMEVLKTATLLGAVILEKHFTFDKSLPGNDHYHAMDKEDLKYFFKDLERIFLLLGDFEKKPILTEESAIKNARRSLVMKKKITAGEIISFEHLTWKRPASGISPKFIDEVLGRKVLMGLEEDTILQWNMIE
ncbi:MAG TPA: N-acetylneuraminate synthase family protein [Ignavibacteria bacterium]|nr:N-acetylneuraminate synthase family protein [Ignavibacteria bacterium]